MVFKKQRQILCADAVPFFGIALLVVAIFINAIAFAKTPLAQEAGAPQQIIPQDVLSDQTPPDNDAQDAQIELAPEQQDAANTLQENVSFNDDSAFYEDQSYEDLILAVLVEREVVSPGIFAIQKDNRYYLPLAKLSDLLTFNAEIDYDRGLAQGWAISEDRNFVIDAGKGVVSYQGRTAELPSEAVLDTSLATDDFYVQMEVLNSIWPLAFEMDLPALILRIYPDEDLPYQKLRERQKRKESLMAKKEKEANKEKLNLPFIAKPYKLFGMPSFDFTTGAGFDARRDSSVYSFGFNGVQDLLFASADYGANYSIIGGELDKPDNLRLRFTRENAYDRALPFGLEQVRWGDVNLKSRDLIVGGRNGTGATFTSKKRQVDNEFDQITIDGVAIAGWEIELYRNDQLIDFGVVDETGVYRFEDVSISYGNNRIRVVFYGPQGQIQERVENYFYQASMLKPGESELSGGVLDAFDPLIEIDERVNPSEARGLAASAYAAHGFTNNFTAFVSASTLKDLDLGTEKVRRNYVTAGAIGSFNTTIAQLELYKNLGEGHAADLRTLSDFKGFRVNTQLSLFSDFESPDAGRNSSAKDLEFDVKVKKNVRTFLGGLGLDAGYNFLSRKSGVNNSTYTFRQSLGKGGTRFTHQTRTTLSNGNHSGTTGRIDSTSRHDKWRWRNSLNYSLFPERRFTSFQTQVRRGTARDSSVAFRLSRNFDSKEVIVGVQLAHDFKKFLGSVDADWSSDFGTSIMFRASAAIGPYARDGGYYMQSDPLRAVGPVSAFIYQDRDYDGVFSEGDTPVPDTQIALGNAVNKKETDENGYLLLRGSSQNKRIDVTVHQKSIDDPYTVPATPGYSIYPRPGVLHALDFALIETGAIDGTIRWTSGKPVAGLSIQIMNSEGDIVQTTKTASDGYYTFERIPPESYTIRADPASGYTIPFKYVDLTPDNLFQFGMDIDAVDLDNIADGGVNPANSMGNIDLNTNVDNDGNILVRGIRSIAEGLKSKRGMLKQANAAAAPQKIVKQKNTSVPAETSNTVQAIRVGHHPNKVRVVLDLSGPINYTLSYDPNSNSVFVEMPYVQWGARTAWDSDSKKILNYFRTEPLNGSGILLTLGVEDGIKIGASGLLKANGDKKDRLYIDIEQK